HFVQPSNRPPPPAGLPKLSQSHIPFAGKSQVRGVICKVSSHKSGLFWAIHCISLSRGIRGRFLSLCIRTKVLSLAPARLLLVDDDESIITASSVMEALQRIASEHFDVLVSDLHMPGAGDGLIVVGAMRHANPRAVT